MEKDDAFYKRVNHCRERYSVPDKELPSFIKRILLSVELDTGVSVRDMRRLGRPTNTTLKARQLAVFRLREKKLALTDIAAIFYRRSHVTIQRLIKKEFGVV